MNSKVDLIEKRILSQTLTESSPRISLEMLKIELEVGIFYDEFELESKYFKSKDLRPAVSNNKNRFNLTFTKNKNILEALKYLNC